MSNKLKQPLYMVCVCIRYERNLVKLGKLLILCSQKILMKLIFEDPITLSKIKISNLYTLAYYIRMQFFENTIFETHK